MLMLTAGVHGGGGSGSRLATPKGRHTAKLHQRFLPDMHGAAHWQSTALPSAANRCRLSATSRATTSGQPSWFRRLVSSGRNTFCTTAASDSSGTSPSSPWMTCPQIRAAQPNAGVGLEDGEGCHLMHRLPITHLGFDAVGVDSARGGLQKEDGLLLELLRRLHRLQSEEAGIVPRIRCLDAATCIPRTAPNSLPSTWMRSLRIFSSSRKLSITALYARQTCL